MKVKALYVVIAALHLATTLSTVATTSWKFDFGSGPAAPGYIKVGATDTYTPVAGYGFLDTKGISSLDRKTADPLRGDFCTASGPFVFAVNLPEGNYDVKVYYGDASEAASTAIKAEARRLILPETATLPGQMETCDFTVNVRRPAISTGGSVQIDNRETDDWDDKLTLEFNGKRPCIGGVEITEAKDALTLYIAGDSTVTDYMIEPWCAWGQMLPRFFQPGVAIANYAHPGLALFSFERQNRLEKILSTMRKGDYLFIQFGHNDQKDKTPGAGPITSYKANLKKYVAAVRAKEGIPVLVTPMERRRWANGVPQPTLSDYAEAVRQVGAEENVPVIDLNSMSLKFYQAMGPDASTHAFVHYPANTYPGQTVELKDDTHFNAYGAYELARCVVEGIRKKVPAVVPRLRADAGTFDPSRPDALNSIGVPPSALRMVEKPAGN
jgi:lysophospholipase L1-like esterase